MKFFVKFTSPNLGLIWYNLILVSVFIYCFLIWINISIIDAIWLFNVTYIDDYINYSFIYDNNDEWMNNIICNDIEEENKMLVDETKSDISNDNNEMLIDREDKDKKVSDDNNHSNNSSETESDYSDYESDDNESDNDINTNDSRNRFKRRIIMDEIGRIDDEMEEENKTILELEKKINMKEKEIIEENQNRSGKRKRDDEDEDDNYWLDFRKKKRGELEIQRAEFILQLKKTNK